jgi:hypothetical protein
MQGLHGNIDCDRTPLIGEGYCLYHLPCALRININELEDWKNKAKEKMPIMQMKIHELEAKLEIAVESMREVLKNRRCSEQLVIVLRMMRKEYMYQ